MKTVFFICITLKIEGIEFDCHLSPILAYLLAKDEFILYSTV